MKQTPEPSGLDFSEHANAPPSQRGNVVSMGTEFSYPPTPEDWAKVQKLIYRMYVLEKQPLVKVEDALASLPGFKATQRMIKARLKTWGYVKNAKKEDWGLLAVLHHNRKRSGKNSTIFEIHGHRKTVKDLQRFIRNQSMSQEEFLAAHLAQAQEVPDYIRALTPEAEDPKDSPVSTINSPPDPWSLSSPTTSTVSQATGEASSSQSHPLSSIHSSRVVNGSSRHRLHQPHHQQRYQPYYFPKQSSPFHQTPKFNPCGFPKSELLQMSDQMLRPSPLGSLIGDTDMKSWTLITLRRSSTGKETMLGMDNICPECGQRVVQHFPSLETLDPTLENHRSLLEDSKDEHWHLPVSTREEGAWSWMSFCFLACMYFSRTQEQVGQKALQDAGEAFERLLQKKDRLLLTAALLMVTILHTHDQDYIAARVLNSAKAVVDRLLPEQDPIRRTMNYFAQTANLSKQTIGITSDDLKSIYLELRSLHGQNHPYVITAHHNYGFFLRLEDKLEASEQHLRETYHSAKNMFGEQHMQTITSLCVLAGCLRPQTARQEECIELYRTVLKDSAAILGNHHPYVLRVRYELAERLKGLPGPAREKDKVLKLYKEVLWGRSLMLGRSHSHTIKARRVYENWLKEIGQWTDGQSQPSAQQREVEDLFSRDMDMDLDSGWPELMQSSQFAIGGTPGVSGEGSRVEQSFEIESGSRCCSRSTSNTRTPSPMDWAERAGY